MEARIGKELAGAPSADEAHGLALDLTASEIVLYEAGSAGDWRRFAGVALDDPEFLEVMALLREEAESELGQGRPVLMWLPAEQVLRLSVRIEAREPEARLAAAFRIASRETGQSAEELAVALGPADAHGEATLLVTYAATWHEARDYAARWGFVPGAVSTRHHAEAVGPGRPDFRLAEAAGDGEGERSPEAEGGSRLARLAVGLVAVVAAALAGPAMANAPQAAPLPTVRAAALIPPARPEALGEAQAETPSLSVDVAVVSSDGPPRGAPAAEGPASPGLAAPLPRVRPAGLAPALRLDRVALIGILNLDTGREALLRLPDGAFVTLRSGEVLDGWEVTAIGPDTMQVRRGAETLTLILVSG